MSFNSIVFIWIFLPSVIFGYLILSIKPVFSIQNVFLILASLLFYSWGDMESLPFLLSVTAFSWLGGIILSKVRKKTIVLFFFISCLIGCLLFYKYWNFFILQINNIFHVSVQVRESWAPLGISFILFQSVSYLADTYKGKIQADKNPVGVALYITFFPQLITGPIVRYTDVKSQLYNRKVSLESAKYGIKRFIRGLGKKVILADCMGHIVDTILSFDPSKWGSLFAWIVLIGYSLQIYYDFSGYTDMALGLGKAFGFVLPENFNLPYMSESIQEFWRRWHITLSSWFRDYVYIPLGGNRKGNLRTYINLSAVFFLTGLWHGADWNFIFWGMWHGTFMLAERLFLGKYLKKSPCKGLNYLYTVFVVFTGWMFFRISSAGTVFSLLKLLFIPTPVSNDISLYYFINPYTISMLFLGILLCGPLQYFLLEIKKTICRDKKIYQRTSYWGTGILYSIILIYSLTQVVSSTYSAFIYQQF